MGDSSSSSSSSSPSSLIKLVQTLSSSIVYTESPNFETNKKLWDNYAREWSPEAEWVQKMVKNLPIENQEPICTILGEEWSDKSSLNQVIEEFIFPFLRSLQPPFVVGEIGTGGARVVSKVINKVVGDFYCFDISNEMLSKAKSAMKNIGLEESEDGTKSLVKKDLLKVHFILLEKSELPPRLEGKFDFIYSFDVFPHLDIHTQYQYLCSIKKSLKIGGHAFISVADLTTPFGWSRFERQSKYTVGGFYFICPEIVRKMVSQVGLQILKESSPSVNETNLYYNRDFLFVVQKRD